MNSKNYRLSIVSFLSLLLLVAAQPLHSVEPPTGVNFKDEYKKVSIDFIGDFRLVRDTTSAGDRYPYGTSDSNFFDLATLGTAFTFPLSDKSMLYLQLQFDSKVNESGGDSFIDEAWYYKNELIGKLGGKFGIFPLPFSREHKGPFNSTIHTITPSIVNSFFNDFRVTGVEFKKGYTVPGKHFDWRFGIASGVDTISFAGKKMAYGDWWHKKVSPSTEGSTGAYGYIGKNHSNSCHSGKLSWHGGFFTNNGNSDSMAPSGDTDLLLMDFGWETGKFAFLFQGVAGHTNYETDAREAVEMNFSLARWSFNKQVSISARYDNWFTYDRDSNRTDRGHGYTGALNFRKTEGTLLQLEYLLARPSHGTPTETSPLWQVRYLVNF